MLYGVKTCIKITKLVQTKKILLSNPKFILQKLRFGIFSLLLCVFFRLIIFDFFREIFELCAFDLD